MLFGSSLEKTCNSFSDRFIGVISNVRVCSVEPAHHRFHRILRVKVLHRRLRPCGFRPVVNDRFAHGHAAPIRARPVDLVLTPLRFCSSVDIDGSLFDQLLGEEPPPAIVGIGLVELEHGELGIPPPSQTFIAEVAIDLVYTIKSTDRQSLQIEFRGDAQEQIHVECVVMSNERLGHGTPGNGLHHRSFYFDEAMRVEKPPH